MTTNNNHYFFHGTSYDNYIKIKENGFGTSKPVVWDCSDEEVTYMYDLTKFIEVEGYDDNDLEYQIYACTGRCNESAQITAALQESNYNSTVVFEFEVPDEYFDEFEDYILPDLSCPHMEDCGAVTINSNTLNIFINEGKINVTVHIFEFYPKLSLFYIGGLYNSDYLDDIKLGMDRTMLEAWKLVAETGDYASLYDTLLCPEEVKTYRIWQDRG